MAQVQATCLDWPDHKYQNIPTKNLISNQNQELIRNSWPNKIDTTQCAVLTFKNSNAYLKTPYIVISNIINMT